jgi:hypothetical protein
MQPSNNMVITYIDLNTNICFIHDYIQYAIYQTPKTFN